MADNLVTLEITLENGGIDPSAALFWVADNGDEQRYTEIRERATVRQETFAGHRWLVRGTRSRQVLLRIVATDEAVQQHRIDVDKQPPQQLYRVAVSSVWWQLL